MERDLIACLVIWLISIPIGYVGFRRFMRRDGMTWTKGNRRAGIAFAILFGPFNLLPMMISEIPPLFTHIFGSPEEPASW